MIQRLFTLMAIFISVSMAHAADTGGKQVFMCMYDGGRDAFTWQATGEIEAPPPGAAVCLKVNFYYCDEVVNASGQPLAEATGSPSRGRFCGSDNQAQGDFPNLKVYAQ